MEEENGKHLRESNENVKDVKSESDDKCNASDDDSDKNQQQMDLKAEKDAVESNAIEQSSMLKKKSQSDDKEGKFNEDREKNKQQADLKDEREVYQDVPLSNIEESTKGKRKRENDEIELNIKKMTSETHNVNSCESNDDNHKYQKYDYMRIRENEEDHIIRLFTRVLDTIIERKNINDADVVQSIKLIKDSFKPRMTDKNITFHETDFTQWENICAYLYRYGPHGAGFARYRILNAIRNRKEVENILEKPDLKIISLGSGPGNDAVGLCSALSELQYPESLKLTLVDKFGEWNECIELVESFIKSENFGKVSELFRRTKVEFQFIQTDLPGDIKSDKKYFKVLREADVIVASKYFTSLDRSNKGRIQRANINRLHKYMKEDAVILVNDKLVFIEDWWRGFHHVYEWPKDKDEDLYWLIAKVKEIRFNSNDVIKSELPIHVFKKRQEIIPGEPTRV